MKFTDNTFTVLKNFASINSGVVFKQGTVQKTISPEKTILVEATLSDSFPVEFGIYDLNQFLGNVNTLNDPDITFDDKVVTLKDNDMTFDYHACSPNLVITPPDKELALKQVDVSFVLPNSTLQKLMKLAVMNGLTHLSVVGKNGQLNLKIHEKSNGASNQGMFNIGDYAGDDFIASFNIDNLKLLPDDYSVELQVGAFARFVNKAQTLKYFIPLESK